MRKIISINKKYLESSLELVEKVFTEWSDAEEGTLVKELVKEIRNKELYVPELELIAVDENEEIIGYAMFSDFHLEGKYRKEILLLSPIAVKTNLQRQHISRDLIEYGFIKAKEMGYKAVIVEGNPQNYRSRGFVTSADYGIIAGKSVELPAEECLMVKELVEGALKNIKGLVEYGDYKALR